jgi:hypothetical protein
MVQEQEEEEEGYVTYQGRQGGRRGPPCRSNLLVLGRGEEGDILYLYGWEGKGAICWLVPIFLVRSEGNPREVNE